MNQDQEVYLGDGLYAHFDGYQINLRAPRADGDHWISLEPDVFYALLRFSKKIGWNTVLRESESLAGILMQGGDE